MENIENTVNNFVGFVLLEKNTMNNSVVSLLKDEWDINCTDIYEESENLTFKVDGFLVAVALMPLPIPDQTAENYVAKTICGKMELTALVGIRLI